MTSTRAVLAGTLVACLVVGAAIPAAASLVGPASDELSPDADAATAASTHGSARADEPTADGRNSTGPPGSKLAGAFGAQQSKVAGNLSERTLTVRLERVDSPAERAAVLAALRNQTDARLAQLRERRERLQDAGAMGDGERAYEAGVVSVEVAVTERLAARGERAAADLPTQAAAEHDVSPAAFRSLRNDSRSLAASLRDDLGAGGESVPAAAVGSGHGGDVDPRLPTDGPDGTLPGNNRTELGNGDAPFENATDGSLGGNESIGPENPLDGENDTWTDDADG